MSKTIEDLRVEKNELFKKLENGDLENENSLSCYASEKFEDLPSEINIDPESPIKNKNLFHQVSLN
jgi:hypothetical protein